MKRLAASLLVLGLTACGGPSEEDVLTPDKIRASESAPELPDIQLSENPEPPPAPSEPERPELNELDNMMSGNEVEADPLAPAEGGIPASFQGRWAMGPDDCRPGDVAGTGLIISPESLMTAESVGRLVQVVSGDPERFAGLFDIGGGDREEELVLAGGGNTLVRVSGGQRLVYRRC